MMVLEGKGPGTISGVIIQAGIELAHHKGWGITWGIMIELNAWGAI